MAHFRPFDALPTWRRVALSAWNPPSDPTAYGTVDVDCEAALAYVARLREESGEKVTLTHVVGKAVAMAIASQPEVNGFASGGTLYLRDTVDVFFQVAFFDEGDEKRPASSTPRKEKAANLAGAKITRADAKSVVQIARALREKAEAIRKRGDAETARTASTLSKVPKRLVGITARAAAYLTYDLRVDMRRLGLPQDAFGSCMVTNVGVFGLTVGHAPLLPFARVPIILTMGAVRDAPAVVNGKIVARKTMSIGVAFDHRIMDGYHAGRMAKMFQEALADPAGKLGPS
jgi:pyruvate/2-oxoglutarate dehydrogenase complex dihydrolipoamide acyltransferase (E2) component